MSHPATTVLDDSPLSFLANLQGKIADARIAYPDILHVEIEDTDKGLWRLATQDASWLPYEPHSLIGLKIEASSLDPKSGQLQLSLSGDLDLIITPAETCDNLPSWELIRPDGATIEFGPSISWQINLEKLNAF